MTGSRRPPVLATRLSFGVAGLLALMDEAEDMRGGVGEVTERLRQR